MIVFAKNLGSKTRRETPSRGRPPRAGGSRCPGDRRPGRWRLGGSGASGGAGPGCMRRNVGMTRRTTDHTLFCTKTTLDIYLERNSHYEFCSFCHLQFYTCHSSPHIFGVPMGWNRRDSDRISGRGGAGPGLRERDAHYGVGVAGGGVRDDILLRSVPLENCTVTSRVSGVGVTCRHL